MRARVHPLQSCPTLCGPTDRSPPGSSVHGILQARILEWVVMPPPGDLPNPGIKPVSHASTCIGRQVLSHRRHLGSPLKHRASKFIRQMGGYGVFLRLSLCLSLRFLFACLLAWGFFLWFCIGLFFFFFFGFVFWDLSSPARDWIQAMAVNANH